MSNLSSLTKEEMNALPVATLIELFRMKSPRLHPFCLIGLPIDEARERMRVWTDNSPWVHLLVAGKDVATMDPRETHWFCKLDENGCIVDFISLPR